MLGWELTLLVRLRLDHIPYTANNFLHMANFSTYHSLYGHWWRLFHLTSGLVPITWRMHLSCPRFIPISSIVAETVMSQCVTKPLSLPSSVRLLTLSSPSIICLPSTINISSPSIIYLLTFLETVPPPWKNKRKWFHTKQKPRIHIDPSHFLRSESVRIYLNISSKAIRV